MHRFSPKFALRPAAFTACAAAIVCLSGCAGISGTAVSSSLATSIPTGSVHGGQQPIQNAHVYVFAASTGGYGNASTSKIVTGDGTDSYGSYVLTHADGGFNYGGTVTCTSPSEQIYLVALGGNATGYPSPASNTSIGLGAALGNCGDITTNHNFTTINEVTTVALAYALNGFTTDFTHIATSPTNVTGLNRAFTTAATLVDTNSGTALTTATNGGVLPQKKINSIANAIAACINSGSPTSYTCAHLQTYSNATLADTLSDTIAMAKLPTFNPQGVYNLAGGVVPFQPALTTAPDDLSLGIVYTPGAVSLTGLTSLAIDGSGNIWVANCPSCASAPAATDSIVELGPDGTYIGNYTGNGHIHNPKGIAIDATSTYIYSANQAVSGSTHTADEVTQVLVAGGAYANAVANAGDFGTSSLAGIALDNVGDIWVTAPAAASSNVLEFNTSLAEINGSPYTAASGIQGPTGIATDKNGNIWVAGYANNTIGKFTAAGVPTVYSPTVASPQAISIDGLNSIWTVDTSNNKVSNVTSAGADATGSPYNNIGIYDAVVSAIDGSGKVLITDCRNGCNVAGVNTTNSTAPDNLLKLNADGSPATGPNVGTYGVEIDGGFAAPSGLAIDASGNVWVANNGTQGGTASTGEIPVAGTASIAEVIGFASPTVQPLAAAAKNGTIGTKP